MTTFYFYDDLADVFVRISTDSAVRALDALKRDYGMAYMAHMHFATEQDYKEFLNDRMGN